MQNRDIPGMTQLVAWLTRPATTPAPIEVERMLTNITHVELTRITESAAMRARVSPTAAYERTSEVWERCTPRGEDPPPPSAAPVPQRDATALLQYVFDRYWILLGRLAIEIGQVPDDDERAVQIMRMMGWKPPETRTAVPGIDPPTGHEEGVPPEA